MAKIDILSEPKKKEQATYVRTYREHLVTIHKAITQRFGNNVQIPEKLKSELEIATEMFRRMEKGSGYVSLDDESSIGLKTALLWNVAQVDNEMADLLNKGAIEEMLTPSKARRESIIKILEMPAYQRVPTQPPLERRDFIREETARPTAAMPKELLKKQEGFVIMQIGNTGMDEIWKTIYEPTIKKAGLTPRRVDKHDNGKLVKQQIIEYLNQSQIVIADLTNERPNCYLEVGYVMGQNRYRDLILCCREDHHKDSPNYKQNGLKIHFDLEGYNIIWWAPKDLKRFTNDLGDKIRRRMGQQPQTEQPKPPAGAPVQPTRNIKRWIEEQRKEAFKK